MTEAMGSVVLGAARQAITAALSNWKPKDRSVAERLVDASTRAIADQHLAAVSWSEEAHALPVGGADGSTIELTFSSVPRRIGIQGNVMDELDLLTSDGHVAVLGDPGAGKTTTLRRLAEHVALEPEAARGDDFRFVLVVVCREEDWSKASLQDLLAEKVGIGGKLATDLDDPKVRTREILNAGALVLIDGLDEVPATHRAELERDLVTLGRHVRGGKFIVSCRSADYPPSLETFDEAEIEPLTNEQVRRMVTAILGEDEASAFFATLDQPGHPAAQLANRPLFLAQMVTLFRKRGTIPERPVDLYEALTPGS